MTLNVPYLAVEQIEREAAALLAQYAHARGVSVDPPIPVERIIERHLKLGLEFEDMHERLGVPRCGVDCAHQRRSGQHEPSLDGSGISGC